MSTFKDTKDYFRLLATEHVDIKGFVHGNITRLREQITSAEEYPLLWFGTPFIDISHSATVVMGTARSDFAIIINAPEQHLSEAERDDLWEQAEQICIDIIARLRKDAKTRMHTIDINYMDMEPIDPLLVDNAIGWRVEFKIGRQVSICFNEEKWNS